MSLYTYKPIRVVVADDHELLREGFHTMLAKAGHITLAGEASDGRELIEICRAMQPDIVITDIKMPVMDGVEATRILLQEMPTLGVIAFSMFDEENLIVDMLEAGAQGYLLKKFFQAGNSGCDPYGSGRGNILLRRHIRTYGLHDRKEPTSAGWACTG